MTGPAFLFCPADRPDRFDRALAEADVVIVDMEDGVHPDRRAKARDELTELLRKFDPARAIVRVNPSASPEHLLDLEMLAQTPIRTIMLPRVESADELEHLRRWSVIGLCETPRAIISAAAIAAMSNCTGLMWGSEDLAAALGGGSSRTPATGLTEIMRQARGDVLMAARANEVLAVDAVFMDVGDVDGFRAESTEAAQMGFDAKACIHPKQLPSVRECFAPSPVDLEWAAAVLSTGAGLDVGAHMIGDQMVDEAVLRRARKIVAGPGASETK
jgi:citrate lyase subunit beta/citryl-CoA lyase